MLVASNARIKRPTRLHCGPLRRRISTHSAVTKSSLCSQLHSFQDGGVKKEKKQKKDKSKDGKKKDKKAQKQVGVA